MHMSVYANYIGPLVMTDGIRFWQVFPSWLSDQMTGPGTSEYVHEIKYRDHSLKNATLFSP